MTTPTLVTVSGVVAPTLKASTITFRIPTVLRYANGPDVILPGDQLTIAVPANGIFSLQVYGTNDPNWNPLSWTYKVLITGDNLYLEYSASVPYDAGTIDFSDILPAQASSDGVLYAAYNHGPHPLILNVGDPVPPGTPDNTLIVRI
jgi:hypothetical protein